MRGQQINRLPVAGRQQDYQTYQVFAPIRSHWRAATCDEVGCPTVRGARCEEVGCARYETGWRTVLPTTSTDLLTLARGSGRKYIEKPPQAGLIEFVFPAGQQCFDSMVVHRAAGGPCRERHMVQLDRPGIFVVRRGQRADKAPPPSGRFGMTFTRPELWAEHFAEHQQKLADQHNQG